MPIRVPGAGCTHAIDDEVADAYAAQGIVRNAGGNVDDNLGCAARKDTGEDLMAVDGDGLGDSDGAERTGIEAIYLPVDEGLADGAGEGCARRGSAARIGVINHAGNPGARRLRVT